MSYFCSIVKIWQLQPTLSPYYKISWPSYISLSHHVQPCYLFETIRQVLLVLILCLLEYFWTLLNLCVSIRLFVYFCVCLYVCTSLYSLSIYVYVWICLSVCLSISLTVCFSLCFLPLMLHVFTLLFSVIIVMPHIACLSCTGLLTMTYNSPSSRHQRCQ